MRCRIGAPHCRFHNGQQKESQSGRAGQKSKNTGTPAREQHQQHRGYPESLQGNHSGIHGERSGLRIGRRTRIQQIRLQEQGNGEQPERTQQQNAVHQLR